MDVTNPLSGDVYCYVLQKEFSPYRVVLDVALAVKTSQV